MLITGDVWLAACDWKGIHKRLLAILIKIFILRGFYLGTHSLMWHLQTGKGGLHRIAKSGDRLGAVPLMHLILFLLADLAGGLVINHSVQVTEVFRRFFNKGVCVWAMGLVICHALWGVQILSWSNFSKRMKLQMCVRGSICKRAEAGLHWFTLLMFKIIEYHSFTIKIFIIF